MKKVFIAVMYLAGLLCFCSTSQTATLFLDVNGDQRIGLAEAISDLRVQAGANPEISSGCNLYALQILAGITPESPPERVISGTVYNDESQTTSIGAGKTVTLSVNGNTVLSAETGTGGTFEFRGLQCAPREHDLLLIYLDNETEKASLVTLTDGLTNLTGADALSLVRGKVILEHRIGTEITNIELDSIAAIDADNDDGITIVSGNALFDDGEELWIPAQSNYVPGGDVTAGDVTISGTFTGGVHSITVSGDWFNLGDFQASTGTVTLAGTGLQQVQSGLSLWHHIRVTNDSSEGVQFLDGFSTTDFTNTTAGSTMVFNKASTYNIGGAGGLHITGSAGSEIKLQSSEPGELWYINPSGGDWTVDYVDVEYSHNISATAIQPTHSIDTGNTTLNWFSPYGNDDALPDLWRQTYYGTQSPGPLSNNDSDKLNAWEEYILGTNPTVADQTTIFVDCHAGYIGNGSVGAPFKYLDDALDAAADGSLVLLSECIYELDDYQLSKRVIIRGEAGAERTIIRGAAPDGGSSDLGQMVHVTAPRFGLKDVTLRLFRDDKPIISYGGGSAPEVFYLGNVIFRENDTVNKSMIAPVAGVVPDDLYLINNLFHENSGLAAMELSSALLARAFNNSIADNAFGSALILSGVGDSQIENTILRNSSTEITDNSSGTVSIEYCNIEGGYAGAANSYDTPETFMETARGAYRLLPGSAGIDAGTTTGFIWDLDNLPRPGGAPFEVGAYENQATDTDGDRLINVYEIAIGSNAYNRDTDGDGLFDGEEINSFGTSPVNRNSDNDFIEDGDEYPMAMDPAVPDGDFDHADVYYTSFENPAKFPVGPVADTIWGPNGNANNSAVIRGNVTIENVGASPAYDGDHVMKAEGSPGGGLVESSINGWWDNSSLTFGFEDDGEWEWTTDSDNIWVSISYKAPRARLPTDINEAFNIAGLFFAIDENGYLNVYDATIDEWLKDTQVIPDDWVRFTVHRDFPGMILNIWVETRQAFAGIPAAGPQYIGSSRRFRFSFSSVGEQDTFIDLWSMLPFAPF